jgi:hypothetical protein
MKYTKEPLRGLVREHSRLIPKLRRAGLKTEALTQAKELKEYRHKMKE